MYGLINLDMAEAFAIAVPEACGELDFLHVEGSGVTKQQQFSDYKIYHFENADKEKKVFRIGRISCTASAFYRNVKLLTKL